MNKKDLNFVKDVYKEHLEGEFISDLNKKYKSDFGYLFKKYGLKTIDWRSIKRSHKRYEIKWKVDKIENEQESYILGLLYADGWTSNESQLGLRLKKSDYEIIKKTKDYFSKDIKIQENKNCYSFVVSSKEVVENANKIGLIKSRKENISFKLPNIKKELIRHFIRGYFDGDGSFYACKKDKKINHFKGNICCISENFLKEIKDVLNNYNIETSINKENRIGKMSKTPNGEFVCSKDMYRLFFRKKEDVYKIYKFMYENSNIYLKRKKEIFDKFCDFYNMPTLS